MILKRHQVARHPKTLRLMDSVDVDTYAIIPFEFDLLRVASLFIVQNNRCHQIPSISVILLKLNGDFAFIL